MGSVATDSTNYGWKRLEKNSRKFQKAKREFPTDWQVLTRHLHRIYNDLHGIYTVLGVMGHLGII